MLVYVGYYALSLFVMNFLCDISEMLSGLSKYVVLPSYFFLV